MRARRTRLDGDPRHDKVARPSSVSVDTEIFAADELPLSIAVGGIGSMQLLGSPAGLELGAITTFDGWSSQAMQTFGRSVMTYFSGGAESVEVGATLRDDMVVLQVVHRTTDSSDGTTIAEPSGAAESPTFPVRTVGLVVLSLAGDALRLQDVQSEPGSIGSVVSDADQVEVTFSNSLSRLRFSARLRDHGDANSGRHGAGAGAPRDQDQGHAAGRAS